MSKAEMLRQHMLNCLNCCFVISTLFWSQTSKNCFPSEIILMFAIVFLCKYSFDSKPKKLFEEISVGAEYSILLEKSFILMLCSKIWYSAHSKSFFEDDSSGKAGLLFEYTGLSFFHQRRHRKVSAFKEELNATSWFYCVHQIFWGPELPKIVFKSELIEYSISFFPIISFLRSS